MSTTYDVGLCLNEYATDLLEDMLESLKITGVIEVHGNKVYGDDSQEILSMFINHGRHIKKKGSSCHIWADEKDEDGKYINSDIKWHGPLERFINYFLTLISDDDYLFMRVSAYDFSETNEFARTIIRGEYYDNPFGVRAKTSIVFEPDTQLN